MVACTGTTPIERRPDSTVLGRPSSPRRSEDETAIEGSASRTTTPAFAPDDVVARRYRIIRYIARGGMGQRVRSRGSGAGYSDRAEDHSFGGRTAPRGPGSAAEINLARKVTHRNVLPPVSTSGDMRLREVAMNQPSAITFLTMELLDGVTLAQRLRDDGPMDVETARDGVAVQLATGLERRPSSGRGPPRSQERQRHALQP